jgi:dolichol-phosphate mannosyltransferase
MQERNSNLFYLMVWLGYDYVNIPYVPQAKSGSHADITEEIAAHRLVVFLPPIRPPGAGAGAGVMAPLTARPLLALKVFGSDGWRAGRVLMVVVLFCTPRDDYR